MAGRERRRDECQTRLGFCLARNRRISPERPLALAEGRPPDAGRVEKDAKLPTYIKDYDRLYALWRNAIRGNRLGGFGTNPRGEQRIEEEIFSAVAIKDVLRIERLQSFLDTGCGSEAEFFAHGLGVEFCRTAMG